MPSKEAIAVDALEQATGLTVKLGDLSIRHDENARGVENGAKAVGDNEERLGAEGLPDGALQLRVGGEVDAGGSLVEHDDLGVLDKGAGEGNERALADRAASVKVSMGSNAETTNTRLLTGYCPRPRWPCRA